MSCLNSTHRPYRYSECNNPPTQNRLRGGLLLPTIVKRAVAALAFVTFQTPLSVYAESVQNFSVLPAFVGNEGICIPAGGGADERVEHQPAFVKNEGICIPADQRPAISPWSALVCTNAACNLRPVGLSVADGDCPQPSLQVKLKRRLRLGPEEFFIALILGTDVSKRPVATAFNCRVPDD